MIEDIEEIIYLNHLCDSLGMDTITAGNRVAMAMAAFEQGTSDYDIRFGHARGAADLLELMAAGKGLGADLSKDIRHAATVLGMTDRAIHVKGLEPAGYDPRILKGMALGYATSDRGACHLRSTFYKAELSGMIEPDQIEGKAEMFIDFEDRLTLFDAMILCKFYRDIYPWDKLSQLITAATGLGGGKDRLSAIANSILLATRTFNVREGMTPADETLPDAFYRPLEDSKAVIAPADFSRLLADYHELRGIKTG